MLTKKFKRGGLILIGYIILFIAFLFIGPSYLFGVDNNSAAMTVVGLGILGLACSMVIIPLLPDMIEAIE